MSTHIAHAAQLEVLEDWREKAGREMYRLCSDTSCNPDGYKCATRERAEIVRENIVDDALAVMDLVNARIDRIIAARRALRPSEGFTARVIARLSR